ncbi:hypothetical protein Cpin_3157 [Chitinophaga pinensis DSM 2588]|uniref:Uncharacterized protein n=1 Tax=Chitinophaga pinensis (strain ATCC 43595 / DSM 2588 / LMG 13176 / NBRC 15968 / NCIMB 11800 / UQM 2034) TaxID=485918 RepID=A0A979G4G2_CHIPD|nr:hypothetical protein [Chitinophaga pinensis]ACU60624.1 hypothetical protein Cpin_3157 [Chitinophaga pinensis DSM 2588]
MGAKGVERYANEFGTFGVTFPVVVEHAEGVLLLWWQLLKGYLKIVPLLQLGFALLALVNRVFPGVVFLLSVDEVSPFSFKLRLLTFYVVETPVMDHNEQERLERFVHALPQFLFPHFYETFLHKIFRSSSFSYHAECFVV